MKALVIDSAVSCMTIAAKNDDKIYISSFDIGMKQSETIVPAIDKALETVSITASELDYTALCSGPGSFTGLRLAFSALKAIELAYNVPIYGINSLKVYSNHLDNVELPVLSLIDANKDRFYAALYYNHNEILPSGDYELEKILEKISGYTKILLAGPDTKKFLDVTKDLLSNTEFFDQKYQPSPAYSLFELAEKQIAQKAEALQDYDGPIYLRASEAEIKLNEQK